jgi:glutamate racemase
LAHETKHAVGWLSGPDAPYDLYAEFHDEGAAVMNEILVRNEILRNGGPDIIPEITSPAVYNSYKEVLEAYDNRVIGRDQARRLLADDSLLYKEYAAAVDELQAYRQEQQTQLDAGRIDADTFDRLVDKKTREIHARIGESYTRNSVTSTTGESYIEAYGNQGLKRQYDDMAGQNQGTAPASRPMAANEDMSAPPAEPSGTRNSEVDWNEFDPYPGPRRAQNDQTPTETGSTRGDGSPPRQSLGSGSSDPPAHVYNDPIITAASPATEKIFQQRGVIRAADSSEAALRRTVQERGGDAHVMIVTGRTDAQGRSDAGCLVGAAYAGRAHRLYAQFELGADIRPTYVVDRRNVPLMEAALHAAGEQPEHFRIVEFNPRTRWADMRAPAFLRRHSPDMMVAVDVPGRIGRRYYDETGGSVGRYNSARDALFREAQRRGTPTIASLRRGHEVGGGTPPVAERVLPAQNGRALASAVGVDEPIVAGQASWGAFALGTELLRRADILDRAPASEQVRDAVSAVERAGGVVSPESSPMIEGAAAEMIGIQARRMGDWVPEGPDLRGRTLRVGVFDSGSGGILAADVIKRSIERRTGAKVVLVAAGDHGAGTYGPKTKSKIADLTNRGLHTLEPHVDMIVMACNTACTSGKPAYAQGIGVPVVDLISSTREFHQGLVAQGQRVAAFSTQATAELIHPEIEPQVRIYEDHNVTPVGGTDGPGVSSTEEVARFDAGWNAFREEYQARTGQALAGKGIEKSDLNLASLVNRFLPDKSSPELNARLEYAAQHYVDKILEADPRTTTISWCCTHYPELKPFFEQALQARGRENVSLVNPMEYHARQAVDQLLQREAEMDAAGQPYGTGTSRGGTVAVTTAVADKAAADRSIPAERRNMDVKDVTDTLPVVIQQQQQPVVRLNAFGREIDASPVREALDRPMDPIDRLRLTGSDERARSITMSHSAATAAERLMPAQRPMVVTGIPVAVGRGNKFRPDSDGIKGAAEMAGALRRTGKEPVVVTSDAGVAPLRAALNALGHSDIEVVAFSRQASGEAAAARAAKMHEQFQPDAVIGIEVAGRNAQGKYWSADGRDLTSVAPQLDELFLEARRRGVQTFAMLDRGNEAGAGNFPARVLPTQEGQNVATVVPADVAVTAGAGSWGASAVVAALQQLTGRSDLLMRPDQVRPVMEAIAQHGGVDSASGARAPMAEGYSPIVHAALAEQFARVVGGEPNAPSPRPTPPPGSDGPSAGPARQESSPPNRPEVPRRDESAAAGPAPAAAASAAPDGVSPQAPAEAAPPRPAANEAAFPGSDWPEVHQGLASRKMIEGDGTVYVYLVRPQNGAPSWSDSSRHSFREGEIDGWGRVAGGTRTVRWYGTDFPGQGIRGMLPRREMGAKLGTEGGGWSLGHGIYRDASGKIRVIPRPVRNPKSASPQPDSTVFVVSTRAPAEVIRSGGFRDIPAGNNQFKITTPAKPPALPTGWKRARSLKTIAAVTAGSSLAAVGLHAIGIDYGNTVPTGAFRIPRNPLAQAPQVSGAREIQVPARELTQSAEIWRSTAGALQNKADQVRMDPGATPEAISRAQAAADRAWDGFALQARQIIQQDVKSGLSPLASANRIRAGLIAQDRFTANTEAAIQQGLHRSDRLTGSEADALAALDYARIVARDPAFINDTGHRTLAQNNPIVFARTSLVEQGPPAGDYIQRVDRSIAAVGQRYTEQGVRQSLSQGDVASASLQARQYLDALPNPSARAQAGPQIARLFAGEREKALQTLEDNPPRIVGDYLMQYGDAPPEAAQPLAAAMQERFGTLTAHFNSQGSAGAADFITGLSAVAQAADAHSATPAWAQAFAQRLVRDNPSGVVQAPDVLQQAARQAVDAGDAKLPVALANALNNSGQRPARDAVLQGISEGLHDQQQHLDEAVDNLTGAGGTNAAGATLAYYAANFGGNTNPSRAAAVHDFRRLNPSNAGRVDQADRIVGQRGAALYANIQDIQGLAGTMADLPAATPLHQEVQRIVGDDSEVMTNAQAAMSQSPQLRQDLLARARQEVPDPRTSLESLANPAMFITRHVSGTTRMMWTLMADANFNAMVSDPTAFPRRWEAFKGRAQRMATAMGMPEEQAARAVRATDDYLDRVRAIDPSLPEAQRARQLAQAYAQFDTSIQNSTGVGAKTINNISNPHSRFGQTLRWVANAGFITHNISTPTTFFRPMLDPTAVNGRTLATVLYQGTQPPFVLKSVTSAMQHPSMASRAIQAGRAADPEGLLPWKYTFAAGTLGVGIADAALGFVQYTQVPDWVTFTNFGMGVSGILDGGVGLVNTTAGWLTQKGAVELGRYSLAPELGVLGGLGVAGFTGVKSGCNIIHHYDRVDAMEAQRNPELARMLQARGFTPRQAEALLDASHSGVSPMVAFNAAFERAGMTPEQGLTWLQRNLTDQSLNTIPGFDDAIHAAHWLTDHRLNMNDGSLPATDPLAARAGEVIMGPDGNLRLKPDSVDGLVTYLKRLYGPLAL